MQMRTENVEKILKGLDKVYDKVVAFKKLKGTEIVIMRDKKIVRIKPE